MIFVDTGFFLALLDSGDSLHGRARAWALQIRESLLVSEYVLWETINACSSPPNRPKAHALVAQVRSIAGYEIVMATSDLFDGGLRLHEERPDKDWSLTDCISFILMDRRSVMRALAFDHHFEQAGYEALLRRDPP